MSEDISVEEETKRLCDRIIDWELVHEEYPAPLITLIRRVHARLLERIKLAESAQGEEADVRD